MTPTTRASGRRTRRKSASDAPPGAQQCANASKPSAQPTVLPRSRNLISTRPHGGMRRSEFFCMAAWRSGTAKDSAYPAEMFVTASAHYVAVDFVSVGDAGGNLMTMADQVRRAVAWVYKNAASFGGDRERLYLSGHSSGSHLAGVVLVTDWQKDFGLPQDIVKGALLMSGMYDLKPVRLSKRSDYVKFTDEMEQALSTQRHLHRLNTPIILAHGTLESPEFQRQTREFAAAVKAAGKPVQLIVGEGYNHFELPETFGNPYGLTGRAALEQMKLTPGHGPQ